MLRMDEKVMIRADPSAALPIHEDLLLDHRFSTIGAAEFVSKWIGVVSIFLPVSVFEDFLYPIELFPRDNRFVMVFDVIHWCFFAVVLYKGMRQVISRHIFLKNQVSTVFLVYKNRTHQSSVPHLFSCWREDLPLLQFPAHFCCGKTSLIEAENQPDNLCFILYNDVGS